MKTFSNLHILLWIVAIVLGMPGQSRAVWYAYSAVDGKAMRACVDTKNSLTVTIDDLQKQKNCRCAVDLNEQSSLVDYPMTCTNKNKYLFFRDEEACGRFLQVENQPQSSHKEAEAPKEAYYAEKWVYSSSYCRRQVFTSKITPQLLESAVRCCECASLLSSFSEKELTDRDVISNIGICKRLTQATYFSRSEELVASRHESRPQQLHIRVGQSYDAVMNLLRSYSGSAFQFGDRLSKTYKDPTLLAYPENGGTCTLNFENSILDSCSGCSPKIFSCKSSRWRF